MRALVERCARCIRALVEVAEGRAPVGTTREHVVEAARELLGELASDPDADPGAAAHPRGSRPLSEPGAGRESRRGERGGAE